MRDDMRAFNFNFHNLSALCPKCIETFPIGDIHIHGEINFDEHAFPNTCRVKKAGALTYPMMPMISGINDPIDYPALVSFACPHCLSTCIPIDSFLDSVLVDLNAIGVYTSYSCAGHKGENGNDDILPYIALAVNMPISLKEQIEKRRDLVVYERDYQAAQIFSDYGGTVSESYDPDSLTRTYHFNDPLFEVDDSCNAIRVHPRHLLFYMENCDRRHVVETWWKELSFIFDEGSVAKAYRDANLKSWSNLREWYAQNLPRHQMKRKKD